MPLLAIALAVAQTDAGDTTAAHAARLVGEAIGWGIVGGVVAGVAAGCVLRAARSRDWIEARWIPVVPVIGAVGAFGIADARGGSGFIAAFVGGAVFGRIAGRAADDAAFSEELGSVLNGVTLIVFGAAVLGSLWSQIGLVEVFYAVLSLTLVRMLPVAIAMIGSRARPPTVLFLGWFGPRGLASIVFGVVVVEAAGLPHTSELVRRAHRDRRTQRRRPRHHRGTARAPLCHMARRGRWRRWKAHPRPINAGATRLPLMRS